MYIYLAIQGHNDSGANENIKLYCDSMNFYTAVTKAYRTAKECAEDIENEIEQSIKDYNDEQMELVENNFNRFINEGRNSYYKVSVKDLTDKVGISPVIVKTYQVHLVMNIHDNWFNDDKSILDYEIHIVRMKMNR